MILLMVWNDLSRPEEYIPVFLQILKSMGYIPENNLFWIPGKYGENIFYSFLPFNRIFISVFCKNLFLVDAMISKINISLKP